MAAFTVEGFFFSLVSKYEEVYKKLNLKYFTKTTS